MVAQLAAFSVLLYCLTADKEDQADIRKVLCDRKLLKEGVGSSSCDKAGQGQHAKSSTGTGITERPKNGRDTSMFAEFNLFDGVIFVMFL